MIGDAIGQDLLTALMAALVVLLWVAGIWTLVKDESGPTIVFTKLLLVGFVVFLAWWFALPLFR